MSTHSFHNYEPVMPNENDMDLARISCQALARIAPKKNDAISVSFGVEGSSTSPIMVPASAFKMFTRILTQMAEGNGVSLVPIHAELTTQEAADLLNVSRPYLIRLLEDKKIPCRKVGSRRKVLFEDLMRYKNQIDSARKQILDELANEAQNLDLGY